MTKQISQVLLVTWKDGRVTKHRKSGWSEFSDMREQYDIRKDVINTEVQYDV